MDLTEEEIDLTAQWLAKAQRIADRTGESVDAVMDRMLSDLEARINAMTQRATLARDGGC